MKLLFLLSMSWSHFLVIFVVLAVYRHIKKNQSITRCTESTIATVSYED